jgi:hypothetical protein
VDIPVVDEALAAAACISLHVHADAQDAGLEIVERVHEIPAALQCSGREPMPLKPPSEIHPVPS